jgi:hypothetical protein
MHGYFVFDITGANNRIRVIYCSTPKPETAAVIAALRKFSMDYPPADSLYLIVPNVKDRADAVAAIIADEEFKDRFPEIMRYFRRPESHIITFSADGQLNGLPATGPPLKSIIDAGMSKIFYERKGLLTAQDGYHYAKPSGKHSQSFMRVGNVMASSAEIEFIAFACLGHIALDVSRIYCDTGAIFPVAYAISRLREILCMAASCLVESFSSFDGLATFQFELPGDAIVLISASTSGGLATSVQNRERLFSEDQILTLYFFGDGDPDYTVCNLSQLLGMHGINADDLRSFPNAESCDYCKNGWNLISLDGDQFLPGEARVESIVIRAVHSPGSWLSRFVEAVHGHSIIKAYYTDSEDGSEQAFQVFLDVEQLFSNDVLPTIDILSRRFDWIIDQNVPASLVRIVHLSDPASLAMATSLKVRSETILGRQVELVDAKDLFLDVRRHIIDQGTTIVVASTVSSGRSLHSVAQVLRATQPNQQLHYFVGIVRCSSDERFKELRSNLTFGPREHGFWYLYKVALPISRGLHFDSWSAEVELLRRITSDESYGEHAMHVANGRINEIQAGGLRAQHGLMDDLFIRPATGVRMRLQEGFAFLDFDYGVRGVTQAEVFFVVTAILHYMRTSNYNSPLSQHSFVRKILSPRCFDRFNDGVIQASLLRCANPSEIDYSTTELESREMTAIILVLIGQLGNQVGEASREFAIALATHRLRLRPADTAEVCRSLQNSGDEFLAAVGRIIDSY